MNKAEYIEKYNELIEENYERYRLNKIELAGSSSSNLIVRNKNKKYQYLTKSQIEKFNKEYSK